MKHVRFVYFRNMPILPKSYGIFWKNNINFTKKDVAEPENLSSLLKLGGKAQIPFLDDPQNGVSMYESDDIIEYAKNRG